VVRERFFIGRAGSSPFSSPSPHLHLLSLSSFTLSLPFASRAVRRRRRAAAADILLTPPPPNVGVAPAPFS